MSASRDADRPWRGPETELGAAPAPPPSAALHHALVAALVTSIFVQLLHLAVLAGVLGTAADVAREPHALYDPEDEVTFAFVVGFGAELAIGLVTGALWIAWLAQRLSRDTGTRRRIFALHFTPIVQLFAPFAGFGALDRSGCLRGLRVAWLTSWSLMIVAFFGPFTNDAWLAPLRTAWCAPRGLGLVDGNDWCRWALESYVHVGGALAAMVAANVAIALVRRLR